MNAKKSNRKRICFALQGGGAYGAYTWGILDKFLEDERFEIDAISATSAGSVNAVILAHGMATGGPQGARDALGDFWKTLGKFAVFFNPIRQMLPEFLSSFDISAKLSFLLFDTLSRTISPYILNPFNLNILRLILLEKVDFEKINKNDKIKLFLSATNVKTGRLKIFEGAEITLDAVLASGCLPYLSQAIEINGEFYWDGGFMGNPPIFPLIYTSEVNDIIIIHNNPIVRNSIPISSQEIANRINEVSFNSSLLRELRAIYFVSNILDKGWIKDEYKDDIRRKFMHIIRSDEVMYQFSLINKYKSNWDFLSRLRDLGRKSAEHWIKENFDHIGEKSTIEFKDFL